MESNFFLRSGGNPVFLQSSLATSVKLVPLARSVICISPGVYVLAKSCLKGSDFALLSP